MTGKRIIKIIVLAAALFPVLVLHPVYAAKWTFRSASENAVPWNKMTGNLETLKSASANAVSDDKAVEGSEEDGKKSEDRKKEKSGDKTGNTEAGKAEDKTEVNRIDRDDWRLILVNKQNPIPDDYEAVMVPINGGVTIREEIKEPLMEMFEAAQSEGVSLQACSGYRSHAHQQELFDRKIRNYTRSGLSYLDAFRIGSYSVIIPGTSEHELGMAVDIVTPGYTALNEGFANTQAGRWLKNNAFKYGFILRYPKGKEYITGIIFEPWHYRYVGKEAAIDIRNSGLTLEEYLEEAELY